MSFKHARVTTLLIAVTLASAGVAAATLPVDPDSVPETIRDAIENDEPIVSVEDIFDDVEQNENVDRPIRDDVENATIELVPANYISQYPDYAQRFAKFYARSAAETARDFAPSDLPEPTPGNIPAVALAVVDYVDTHTSPAALVSFVEDLFPTGVFAQWMADPVNRAVGFDAVQAIGDSPSTLFGGAPPQQGLAAYFASQAVTDGRALVLADDSAGQRAARGSVGAILGTDASDAVFEETLDPLALDPANAKAGCFTTGGVTAWLACATPEE